MGTGQQVYKCVSLSGWICDRVLTMGRDGLKIDAGRLVQEVLIRASQCGFLCYF